MPVELSVSFDQVALTSSDIIGLRVGDVVPLNHPVNKPVTVSVDGVECYDAVTGRRGKRLACLIVGTHEEHHDHEHHQPERTDRNDVAARRRPQSAVHETTNCGADRAPEVGAA